MTCTEKKAQKYKWQSKMGRNIPVYIFSLPLKHLNALFLHHKYENNFMKNMTTATVCISRRVLKGKKYRFPDIHKLSISVTFNMAAKSGEN